MPYRSFREFYPFYLSQHRDRTCRRLHVVGCAGALAILGGAFALGRPWWALAALGFGYGCAWIGHAFFERNRPATFRHPFYSFIGDWAMFRDVLSGRIPF